MNQTQPPADVEVSWDKIRPVLDEAMAELPEPDREALLLRFLQRRSLAAVGLTLGISDDAARKRVDRALEKLRCILHTRGIDSTNAALEAGLAGAAVVLAPNGLAAAVTTAALGGTVKTAAAASGLAFVQMKIGLVAALTIAGLGTTVVVQRNANARLKNENRALQSIGLEAERRDAQPGNPSSLSAAASLADNLSLSNEVRSLRARLAVFERQQQPATLAKLLAVPNDDARQLASAALQGDLTALDKLAEMTTAAVRGEHPDMTLEEQNEQIQKLQPLWAAFDMIAEEASQDNESALRVVAKALGMPELNGLAVKSLGVLAGRGSEGALNIILDPQKYGIKTPSAGTIGALKPAAENGNARAIEALAGLADTEGAQPLWFMAADALRQPAELGNPVAVEALISFSRSTNQSVLNAVRAGLSAAAANQNERAIEALAHLGARQASR